MMALGEEEILRIIRPVGLAPGKAKRLHGMATMLVQEFKSVVPQTFEKLEQLPGVGHKTASVVMAQAFGMHGPPPFLTRHLIASASLPHLS
jgi:endonuclease-3